MIVMKFGGTSLRNADKIKNAANIIKSSIEKKPVVIVSAVSGITDKLIELGNASVEGNSNNILENIKEIHHKILEKLELDKSLLEKDFENLTNAVKDVNGKNLDAKTLDSFQSFGEQMSSKIVAAELNKIGIKAQAFNAWDLGFLTNSEFGSAEPLEETFNNLNENIKKLSVVPVITGFIGKTKKDEITTIGRGGSDYTAAIIGSAINSDEIQIWSDVDGIMSSDPKIVSNARTIDKVSFAEASELAYFGAKVLHPKTIFPAMEKNIPVRVLNSMNPSGNGTTILNKVEKSKEILKSVAYKRNVTLINIQSTRMLGAYGFLARLFSIFNKYKKSVDVVSTSEVSVSLTIDNNGKIEDIVHELEKTANVQIFKNKVVICAVGEGTKNTPGIIGKIFSAIGNNNINVEMISQGASEINTTFIVDQKDAENAIKILHKVIFG